MKRMCLVLTLFFAVTANAQDFALKQLEESPRHHEWVEVNHGDRTVHCFVAYPEKPKATQALIVIHENRGLTDWVLSFADQLAAEGYLAIAPDLLSGFSDDTPKTSDFPSSDAARTAIYQLDADQVTADLQAVFSYIKDFPSANGTTSVVGFCWGGSQSFRFATNQPDLKAALVFYGTAPKEADAFKTIKAPVYGFYGENDQRVNATIEKTAQFMQEEGKSYEYEIYKGVGHAYMRRADSPKADEAGKKAKDASIERINSVLK